MLSVVQLLKKEVIKSVEVAQSKVWQPAGIPESVVTED